ncbi:MAG: metallophosphoesterase family protein [Deltaproteobacteria bacterium]|nr:metallophosphoesterase family protein [Deltaproteobacteria bacterium]
MRLHILSDLHLEYRRPLDLPRVDADVVVLAGDVDLGTEGVRWAARTFPKPVIYVPGNHEFYTHDVDTALSRLRAEGRRSGHVHVLANDTWTYQGVRFVGTTLWTDFALFGPERANLAMNHCQRSMRDFQVIRQGWRRLTPEGWAGLHTENLGWLSSILSEPCPGPTVVVTHHLPSRRSVVTEYRTALLSAAFASDLEYLIGRNHARLWIHGHTHRSLRYRLKGTEVVCNPRGYPLLTGQWENPEFEADLVVTL